jgi:hypothetical protein
MIFLPSWPTKEKCHAMTPFLIALFTFMLFELSSFQPFEALLDFVKDINRFLEKLITWPRECGLAIANCHERFPAPT